MAVKVICGLGNPGIEYRDTRHNVGWWVVNRAREDWHFPPFGRARRAAVSEGVVQSIPVLLLKPLTFMNRSGAALLMLMSWPDFQPANDLLVVVDDAALDVGRVRFRSGGSSGGHNGLKSVETVLRTRDYARLRLGVGGAPPDVDLADWVLAPFPREDEERVRSLLPALVDGMQVWLQEGIDAAMQQCNR